LAAILAGRHSLSNADLPIAEELYPKNKQAENYYLL